MQIFVLDANPFQAAKHHCDKHVVKMVLEYAQLLSTSHRILDGARQRLEKPNGKMQNFWLLSGEQVKFCSDLGKYKIDSPLCYTATHQNHPCATWTRTCDANYYWLFSLFQGCLREYRRRYGKEHATCRLLPFLEHAPTNIKPAPMTPFPLAMPDEYKVNNDAIASYRAFYVGDKARFAKWTNTPIPSWFEHAIKETHDVTHFTRPRKLGT